MKSSLILLAVVVVVVGTGVLAFSGFLPAALTIYQFLTGG